METTPEPAVMTRRSGWSRVLPWCVALLTALIALTLVVPNVLEKFQHTGTPRWHGDLRALSSALDEYAARNRGRYPDDLEQLVAPDPHGYRFLNYSRIPLDPWKTPYLYLPPTTPGARPIVYSAGPDRLAGTSDDLPIDDE